MTLTADHEMNEGKWIGNGENKEKERKIHQQMFPRWISYFYPNVINRSRFCWLRLRVILEITLRFHSYYSGNGHKSDTQTIWRGISVEIIVSDGFQFSASYDDDARRFLFLSVQWSMASSSIICKWWNQTDRSSRWWTVAVASLVITMVGLWIFSYFRS